jgi:hypothetical protein
MSASSSTTTDDLQLNDAAHLGWICVICDI